MTVIGVLGFVSSGTAGKGRADSMRERLARVNASIRQV
jgi:hypothetical protein